MTKRFLLAIAVLALTVIPSFADSAAPGISRETGSPDKRTSGMAAMKRQMMRNPQHLLMKAYHQNVIAFGTILEKAAQQGETVPPELARTAIAEMRRSTTEMEKYRAGVLAGMPSEMRNADMHKLMDEHLAKAKTHLRELENLAQSDRIPSGEVLEHVRSIFRGCDGACELMPGKGMPGMRKGMRGMHDRGMQGCGCCGCDSGLRHDLLPPHHQMMREMTQNLKAQDTELLKRVDQMKKAPKDKKVDQLADIVASMVQQRAAMTVQMENMQRRAMNGGSPGYGGRIPASPPPPELTNPGDEDDADAEDGDDVEDMDMQDVNE